MEVSVDEELRRRAVEIFSQADLTEEEAVILFYKRTVALGKIALPGKREETRKAKRARMNARFAEWDAF